MTVCARHGSFEGYCAGCAVETSYVLEPQRTELRVANTATVIAERAARGRAELRAQQNGRREP